VAHHLRADLDQLVLQGRQRPVLDRLRRRQRAQEIAEVVGECMKLEPHRVNPRPSVRVTRGAGSGQHLASVLQEGRENANIDAGLGFIWRISDEYSDANAVR
jgi:hypothetical protein